MATGVCGGFTTFSAFSNETVALIRDGQFLYAMLYVLASVIFRIARYIFSHFSFFKLCVIWKGNNPDAKLLRIFIGESDKLWTSAFYTRQLFSKPKNRV